MAGKSPIGDVVNMSVAQRILFVEDVWDSIVAAPEALELTDAERWELDRRLAAYHQNPSAGKPWDEIKRRLTKSA